MEDHNEGTGNSNDIAGITLKEIFEKILGEDNASIVLSKVQSEFDRGIRGDELENFTKQEVEKYTPRFKMPIPIAIVKIRP